MTGPYEAIVMGDEDDDVGVILPNEEYFAGHTREAVDLDYLDQLVTLAKSVGWERVRVAVGEQTSPVLLEGIDGQDGALAVAPIVREDD